MTQRPHEIADASRQQQFLTVISRDEAVERLHRHVSFEPLGAEKILVEDSHGRILVEDVQSDIDVPGFDRSNVDGFAIQAADTFSAMEESPATLTINQESLLPGRQPTIAVHPGTATPISTGGIVPRGADSIVMIEDTDFVDSKNVPQVEVNRSVPPGNMISFAGSDVAKGETVLWSGTSITSREIGVLASLGRTHINVFRKPRVAIISTGDEVVAPGESLPIGSVYDSNAAIISAAVTECGGQPHFLGRVRDQESELRSMVKHGLDYDIILLSGGTSKGAGDLSYRVVEELSDPGIIAHGVALKPGKPICIAVTCGKPVVILPGFPTSAIFTFHEFVAPLIRRLAAQTELRQRTISAKLPSRVNSDRGRTEYLLVRLFEQDGESVAYPMGKGSGSVTTFSLADGFITIPQNCEILDVHDRVAVTLLDQNLQPADLVVIGSHCVGLDRLLSKLHLFGLRTSTMHVGSEAGLEAVKRGACDLAGIHLLDESTNSYNTTFLTDELELIPGYRRMQCFVCRQDDERFQNVDHISAIRRTISDPTCAMVNRNSGSGTRLLTDMLLKKMGKGAHQPNGYGMQVKSHNAVSAAISQGRADWGIAVEVVAKSYGLKTIPIREECYDFVIRKANADHPAFTKFREVLLEPETDVMLQELGFTRPAS